MTTSELPVIQLHCDDEECHATWVGEPFEAVGRVRAEAQFHGWAGMRHRDYCPLHAWIATRETGL